MSWLGTHLSQEAKDKIRKTKLGGKHTLEAKRNMSLAKIGKKFSEERKRRHRGWRHSDEVRRKISEKTKGKNRKYSLPVSEHPLYPIWIEMRRRCLDQARPNFKDYGGRGITICVEWNDFSVFESDMYESFLAHSKIHGKTLGGRSNTTIERKDVDGSYCVLNCIWATVAEQNRNKRTTGKPKPLPKTDRKRVYVKYDGKIMNLKAWSRELGLSYSALMYRWYRGIRGNELFCLK